jgi:hypothetical protein
MGPREGAGFLEKQREKKGLKQVVMATLELKISEHGYPPYTMLFQGRGGPQTPVFCA